MKKTHKDYVLDAEVFSEMLSHLSSRIESCLADSNYYKSCSAENEENSNGYFWRQHIEYANKAEAWERLIVKLAKT